jgi:competence protein ComGC
MADIPSTLIRNTGGFTLVEAIVSAAIATIVGTIMLIILQMNNQFISDGACNTKIQMQYETVVAQIGQNMRKANAIIADGETWASSMHFAADTVDKISLCDNSGTVIAGYEVVGTVLKERLNGIWQDFRVGGNVVQVSNESAFFLREDRKSIVLNISVVSSFWNFHDTVQTKQEMFLCRN